MLRRLLTLLLAGSVLLICAPKAAAEPEQLDTDAVDTFVEDYLDRHGLVGAGVAVVKDGEVIHTAGHGAAEGGEATADTPYATGSVSKSMTSFAVLQLVDAGKIKLDDPVTEHLPEFEMADDRAAEITIRQLLSQTSGMPSPVILSPADDLTEGVQRLSDWELASAPGQQYAYSNMNYHVAGRLVEVVSGTDFGAYLEQNLFAPLGMDDTRSVYTSREGGPGLRHGHVTAYGLAVKVRETEQMLAGAGGVISTANDMARWLAMITNDGKTPDGEQLLSAELLREAQSPQPNADGNGLGWDFSGPSVDPARVGHAGATSRYSAQHDIVPESGYGVAVLLNSFTPSLEHNYSLNSGVIDVTEGRTPEPGTPIPTLIDLGLGLITLLVLGLTALGVVRANRWATRRRAWPIWRYALRLLPHAVFPALAVFTFLVVPALGRNPTTPLDVLVLWLAPMVLLLALALSGLALITMRVLSRTRPRAA